MSKSSTNVRATLDEARLNELLTKAQDSFIELRKREEALAKENHRLALLDAVLAERKVNLDQRESGIQKLEQSLVERELRVQREEADPKSQADFLSKLKVAKADEARRAPEPADTCGAIKVQGSAPALALPAPMPPAPKPIESVKPLGANSPVPGSLLPALFAKPAGEQPIKRALTPNLPPLSRLPPLNLPQGKDAKPLG